MLLKRSCLTLAHVIRVCDEKKKKNRGVVPVPKVWQKPATRSRRWTIIVDGIDLIYQKYRNSGSIVQLAMCIDGGAGCLSPTVVQNFAGQASIRGQKIT